MKHFISLKDLSEKEILYIFELAKDIKKNPSKFSGQLSGKCIGLLFQKPSLRTRVSFEVGIYQLGGKPIYLSPKEVQLGIRESVCDVAKAILFLDKEYSIILMDPPYANPSIGKLVAQLATSPLVGPNSILVVTHSSRLPLNQVYETLSLSKERRHGDSCIAIYRKEPKP